MAVTAACAQGPGTGGPAGAGGWHVGTGRRGPHLGARASRSTLRFLPLRLPPAGHRHSERGDINRAAHRGPNSRTPGNTRMHTDCGPRPPRPHPPTMHIIIKNEYISHASNQIPLRLFPPFFLLFFSLKLHLNTTHRIINTLIRHDSKNEKQNTPENTKVSFSLSLPLFPKGPV